MAKRKLQTSVKRKLAPALEAGSSARRSRSASSDSWFQELISNPTVRYVAGGLATAIVTRLANNISEKYPEISSFLRDNLHQMESKFGLEGGAFGRDERHS